MKRIAYFASSGLAMTLTLAMGLVSTACTDDDTTAGETTGTTEFSINPTIAGSGAETRLDAATIYAADGRRAFVEGDQIVLTKIQRTAHPLASFTYTDVPYNRNSNNGWTLDASYSSKLYWTDVNEHTVIGYSKATGATFATAESPAGTFVGQLATDQTDSTKMKTQDLLLSYSTAVKANPKTSGAAADLLFHHGLSKVLVRVSLSGFASKNSETNTRTTLNTITLGGQPVNYTWDQTSYDVGKIDGAGSGTGDNADVKIWSALHYGNDNDKLFYAYGLVVPGTRTVVVSLGVSYPSAEDYTKDVDAVYQSTFENVDFEPGKRTTLNINMNHINGVITTGVTLSEWGEKASETTNVINKYGIFLTSTDLTGISLGSNVNDVDKASWLYTNSSSKVVDRYGNEGNDANHPYEIRCANDLLALAAEVNNGRSFSNQYVKLATDLYLQPSDSTTAKYFLTWPGIGTAEHSFEGTFLGNSKAIKWIHGNPLFCNVASGAKVCNLTVTTKEATSYSGNLSSVNAATAGLICNANSGTIESCNTIGTVNGTTSAGGICGTNNGTILACCHQGKVSGSSGIAGGICGTNSGTIAACYQGLGNVTATTVGGLVGKNNGGTVANSYYDKTHATTPAKAVGATDDTETVKAMEFDAMEGTAFVNTLNAAITTWNNNNPTQTISSIYTLVLSSLPLIKAL